MQLTFVSAASVLILQMEPPLVNAPWYVEPLGWLLQVEAFLKLSCCEEAFKVACKAKSAADVRKVMAEAGRAASTDVVAMCTEYLQGLR